MVFLDIPHNAGMGNQLFMFAYAYAVSKRKNEKLLVFMSNEEEIRPIIFKWLKVKQDKNTIWIIVNSKLDNLFNRKISGLFHRIFGLMPIKNRIVKLENARNYTEIHIDKGSTYINGFWESYKYFESVKDEIVSLYSRKYQVDQSVLSIIKKAQSCQSVALHIRMGDFVSLGRNFGYDYYDNAIKEMRKRLDSPVFFLVTTDESVKQYYSENTDVYIVNINTDNQDIDEWNILCNCRHHITTNSTYSWWAAYLGTFNQKQILRPSLERYSAVEGAEEAKNYNDFYPEDWIVLEETKNV